MQCLLCIGSIIMHACRMNAILAELLYDHRQLPWRLYADSYNAHIQSCIFITDNYEV